MSGAKKLGTPVTGMAEGVCRSGYKTARTGGTDLQHLLRELWTGVDVVDRGVPDLDQRFQIPSDGIRPGDTFFDKKVDGPIDPDRHLVACSVELHTFLFGLRP